MTDIVERLMICAKFDPDQKEAAKEITRLREENARLRQALLFAELMASEMGVDAREKCQKIYDHLYAIREGGDDE